MDCCFTDKIVVSLAFGALVYEVKAVLALLVLRTQLDSLDVLSVDLGRCQHAGFLSS